MKTTIKEYILSAALLAIVQCCNSQSFSNLNFESANVSGYSPGYGGVPTEDAFPDWSAYYGTTSDPTSSSVSTVFYDGASGGGAIISVDDSNAAAAYGPAYAPLQGNYSALLVGAAGTAVSIGQTGTIASNAKSLIFWANIGGELDVSFDGQMLTLVDVSNAVNYSVYAANISAFAGDTGQLLFTAPSDTGTLLDNIKFSASPIPEPSECALLGLGAVLLGLPPSLKLWRTGWWRRKWEL